MMKCGFCGLEFNPAEAAQTCAGCPLHGGCGLVRCPRCGYEMPPESKLLSWLKKMTRHEEIKESSHENQ